ncbi:MAG: hypothetical protein ACJA1F_002161 [Paracoccaceae bacterium]|jgi:hypothetical protein|tara:strand:- start:225 stop:590 length:366 start_codon:yes stop_codon:yes gene_type:complete
MMVLDSQDGVHLVENGMSKALLNLADLRPDVQARIAAQTAEPFAEHVAHSLAIQNRDTIIADLRLQPDGHKKHCLGSHSDSLDQLAQVWRHSIPVSIYKPIRALPIPTLMQGIMTSIAQGV